MVIPPLTVGLAPCLSGTGPPSRARYEATHPTVTFRVPGEPYTKLLEVREKSWKTWAQRMKAALPSQAASAGKSYDTGFLDAKARYAVYYACASCGKTIIVTLQAAKEIAAKALADAGWKHRTCPQAL